MARDWRVITQRGPVDTGPQDEYFGTLPSPRAYADAASVLIPFTEAEVAAAITACPRGKASGPDGLPNDWYRDHADLLVPILTDLFNEWYQYGHLPPSFSEATVYCIPKKPHAQSGLDFRPIALSNTDYKIFSRLLLARISLQLERLVSPTQFGFVPERQVHDALDVWAAVAHLTNSAQAPSTTTAVLLDFAKDYGTLDRRFLSLALRRLRFPEQLIRAVEAMHLATTASYLVDGFLSKGEAVLNGIRQGCPLAPVLFVLAVDVLYDQLATSPRLTGIALPTGEVITAAGFADDTTVYLATSNDAGALRQELERFAQVSGLGINLDKCQAIALHADGWPPHIREIGFPMLASDQMARLLGAQVATHIRPAQVWSVAVQQIRARLALAQVKTSDVLQRAQIAQAIIVPKLSYTGRHCWPSAAQVSSLQRLLNNFVWHGRFVEHCRGRAWMSAETATLARRDGGIALPDLSATFLQLATNTHLRWGERGFGVRSSIGMILSTQLYGSLDVPRPRRDLPPPPRLHRSLIQTGAALAASLGAQPRTPTELVLCRELLARVGKGTSRTRWWGDHWYFADYTDDHVDLLRLRQLQTDVHGSFDFRGLLLSKVCGDDVLLDADGYAIRPRDFPRLVHADHTIGDLLDIQWVSSGVARFRCRTHDFPLDPVTVRSFRRLCDTVVYNYPAVLAPHDPEDVVRVSPATIDSWRLCPTDTQAFQLVWEPTTNIRVSLGEVRTVQDITAKVRHALDDPTARAHEHEWLGPVRSIWRSPTEPITRSSIKRLTRAAKIAKGQQDTARRATKLFTEDQGIGAAMASITWADINRLPATTSAQRLRLRRIKGNRVPGWDRLHGKHGCPHCALCTEGGTVPHIFWECPAAQTLWSVLLSGWQAHDPWDPDVPVRDQLKRAVFELRLPRFPGSLWRLPALASVAETDVATVAGLHETVQVAWQQQVLETFGVIWKWRHRITDGAQEWTDARASCYLRMVPKSSLRGLVDRLPAARSSRDPRRRITAALAAGLDDAPPDDDFAAARPAAPDDSHVLFFDGGSRGNPGPGGAGAILVTTDKDGMHPRIEWSASMSYAQPSMTNNRAEYHGVLAGLREACSRGWNVEVVGDSQLILRQLARYRPPRNALLRPLYSAARRCADMVGVSVWQHHLRMFNKMADAAANEAMDSQASVQVTHPSDRAHLTSLERHLATDIQEWRSRRLLRLARE